MVGSLNLSFFRIAVDLNIKYHDELKNIMAHFRAGQGLVRLISLNEKTPELGDDNSVADSVKKAEFMLHNEANTRKMISEFNSKLCGPDRKTPEKVVQAKIIFENVYGNSPEFWTSRNLSYITSELRVVLDGKAKTNDIMAVDQSGALWVIELKSDRQLKILKGQVEDFKKRIIYYKDSFLELVEIMKPLPHVHANSYWDGETIKKMIIWPMSSSGNIQESTRKELKDNGILAVDYIMHTKYEFRTNS